VLWPSGQAEIQLLPNLLHLDYSFLTQPALPEPGCILWPALCLCGLLGDKAGVRDQRALEPLEHDKEEGSHLSPQITSENLPVKLLICHLHPKLGAPLHHSCWLGAGHLPLCCSGSRKM
jgi:hypothetical protein